MKATKKISELKEIKDGWAKQGLDSLDFSKILSQDEEDNIYKVWLEKIGSEEREEHLRIRFLISEAILKEFANVTGKEVIAGGLFSDIEYPYMLGIVDGFTDDGETGISVRSNRDEEEWKKTFIPDSEYIQEQWLMYVTGCEKWNIVSVIKNETFNVKEVTYNKEFIENAIEVAKEFWKANVLKERMPNGIEDGKAFERALNAVHASSIEDGCIELYTDEYEDLCAEIIKIKANIARLEEMYTTNINKLKRAMGLYTIAKTDTYTIIWDSTLSKRFDRKRFAKDYPELDRRYTKLVASRPVYIRKLRYSRLAKTKLLVDKRGNLKE